VDMVIVVNSLEQWLKEEPRLLAAERTLGQVTK